MDKNESLVVKENTSKQIVLEDEDKTVLPTSCETNESDSNPNYQLTNLVSNIENEKKLKVNYLPHESIKEDSLEVRSSSTLNLKNRSSDMKNKYNQIFENVNIKSQVHLNINTKKPVQLKKYDKCSSPQISNSSYQSKSVFSNLTLKKEQNKNKLTYNNLNKLNYLNLDLSKSISSKNDTKSSLVKANTSSKLKVGNKFRNKRKSKDDEFVLRYYFKKQNISENNFLPNFDCLTQELSNTSENKVSDDSAEEAVKHDLIKYKCRQSRLSLKKEDNKVFYKKTYISEKLEDMIKKLLGRKDTEKEDYKTIKSILEIKSFKQRLLTLTPEKKLEYYQRIFDSKNKNEFFCSLLNCPQKLNDYINDLPSASYNNYSVGFVKSIVLNTLIGVYKHKNEDRISVILDVEKPKDYDKSWPKISYFALFDGHNGSEVASYLKDNLYKILFSQKEFPEYPYIAIKNAFKDAQKAIEDKLNTLSSNYTTLNVSNSSSNFTNYSNRNSVNTLKFCGSTVSIVLLIDKIVYTANCGDSRIVLSTNHMETFYDITNDHNLNNLNEVTRIKKNGAKVYTETHSITLDEVKKISPGDMTITRSIGDCQIKTSNPNLILTTPEINSFYLGEKDDFIFIGSDGLFSVIDSKELQLLSLSAVIQNFRTLEEEYFIDKLEKELSSYLKLNSQDIMISQIYYLKEFLQMNKNFETQILNGILKSALLFGSSDNCSGLLICFDNLKKLFLETKPERYEKLFEKISKKQNIMKLKSQNIQSFLPTSRVVFTKTEENS